jgi:hypothetical protein
MTFKRSAALVGISAGLLALSGCPGLEENEIQEGVSARLAVMHSEEPIPALGRSIARKDSGNEARSLDRVAAIPPPGDPTNAGQTIVAFSGGYASSSLEHHTVADVSNRPVAIYRAYLVIDDIKLVKCTSVSQLPQKLLDLFISKAAAHAGHGTPAVGGRSLDKANVIDILAEEYDLLTLGDLPIPLGRYCGVQVSFARASSDSYGKPTAAPAVGDNPVTTPDIPEMTGRMFALRADYCSVDDGSGNCLTRAEVDFDDSGLALPGTATVEFATPLEFNATLRSGHVAFGIAYGEWFDGVDATLLASDSGERQKLLDNISGSFHVYSTGNGELPDDPVPEE